MKSRLLVAALLELVALGACGANEEEYLIPTVAPPGECAANLAAQVREENVTWEEILPDVIPAPAGWQVRRSEDRADALTVLDGDVEVGAVQLIQVPLQRPFDPYEGLDALYRRVAEYYDSTEKSRRLGSGGVYVLERKDPAAVTIGEFCGVAYGFTGTEDGLVVEEAVGFGTFDIGRAYVVLAFYYKDDGFKSVESLREYEPSLSELVSSLRFPVE